MQMTNGTDISAGMKKFRTALRRHAMKATAQRLAVHEAMLRLGHASADMVTEEIRKSDGGKITVASVYNILTNLADAGIYSRRASMNNKMYFDVNSFRHIHVYDRENNTYRDIADEELAALIDSKLGRKKFRGYKVEDIDIQITVRPTKKYAKV